MTGECVKITLPFFWSAIYQPTPGCPLLAKITYIPSSACSSSGQAGAAVGSNSIVTQQQAMMEAAAVAAAAAVVKGRLGVASSSEESSPMGEARFLVKVLIRAKAAADGHARFEITCLPEPWLAAPPPPHLLFLYSIVDWHAG